MRWKKGCVVSVTECTPFGYRLRAVASPSVGWTSSMAYVLFARADL